MHYAGYLKYDHEFNAEKDVVLYARIIGVPEIKNKRNKLKGFRSVSPFLRMFLGLGMMFILPWVWIFIFGNFGLMTNNEITHSSISSTADISIIDIIIVFGALLIFIAGIVMTISGLMDWNKK